MEKQGSEFDRGDLVRHISSETGIGEDTCLEVIKRASSAIADALVEFERVEIHDLGVFQIEGRKADSGVLPNGKTWNAPERLKVVFRPANTLKQIISQRRKFPVI